MHPVEIASRTLFCTLIVTTAMCCLPNPTIAESPVVREPSSVAPPAKKKAIVLTFKRVGGFAGFHDDLSVFEDMTFAVNGPRHRPGSGRVGELNAEQKKKLAKVLSTFGKVDWSRGNKPGVADGMQEAITISGSGDEAKLDASGPEFRQIQELVGEILRPRAQR